jgi:aminobenzoyl-glutamate utilization protein B
MKRLYAFARPTAIVLYLYGTGLAAELSTESQGKLMKSIDSYASRMSEVALKIWSAPELGYLETKTSALLQDELRKAGFKIEAGVAGIPTAFVARAGTSDGPVIAILAEIDALPGMSQAAVPERKPLPDQIAGHACGHHLFGSGSVAAAIAVKNWLQETGMKGQIRVYVTPAEKAAAARSIWFAPDCLKTWT